MADAITAFNDKLDELLTNDMKQLASLVRQHPIAS